MKTRLPNHLLAKSIGIVGGATAFMYTGEQLENKGSSIVEQGYKSTINAIPVGLASGGIGLGVSAIAPQTKNALSKILHKRFKK